MKIGIDAKWLFTGHISGRLFIQNILPELFALSPQTEWHIFLNKKDKGFAVPFRKENIKIHYVWSGYNMLSNLFVLPGYARQLKLDAVLFQTFCPKGKSFKSVVFIHDVLFRKFPEYFTWKERLYFIPLKWTLSFADRVITTTEYVKKELLRLNYIKNNNLIDLAPSGVTDIFKPLWKQNIEFLIKTREKYKLPGAYILFAGRLNTRKNIQGLIRSLPMLNDKNISLVIVGEENWKLPPKKNTGTSKEIRSKIHFTGAVPDDELAAIYAMAKIFCFPSFAEGFGLPPLEAMTSGVPVVVSNTTSMPEVCGNAALFIDPRSPETIAEKINCLLENQTLYEQKIKEGLEWSMQYSWKRTAEGILKAIDTAMQTDSKK